MAEYFAITSTMRLQWSVLACVKICISVRPIVPYQRVTINLVSTFLKNSLIFFTKTLVTFGICFKQHFDTRHLVFCKPSPPRMFLLLDLLSEYRIQHGAIGPLCVTSSYSTWVFCRKVSGFATDCPCGVWCRGLPTCLLHVGPPFGNRLLNNSWAVGLT